MKIKQQKEINYRPAVNMSLVVFGLWQLMNLAHLVINIKQLMTLWDWMVFSLPGFLMICILALCWLAEWTFKRDDKAN